MTDELSRRPPRAPDYPAENRALVALAETLSAAPDTALQRLAVTALELCAAESAGISLLETRSDGQQVFCWRAIAGQLAAFRDGTILRDQGPCGIVLDQDRPLLFAHPERYFPLGDVLPTPVAETLLVPFHVGGQPVGTIWICQHSETRTFDREDLRLLTSLAQMTASAHQLQTAMRAAQANRAELEEQIRSRTAELHDREARLRLFIEHAPASIAMFDSEMRYLAVSRRWLTDYGLDGDVVGRSHYEVFPDIPETWKAIHRRCLGGESLSSPGEPFVRANGNVQWIKWDSLPWRTATGTVGGILIATEDITARHQISDKLRESETDLAEAQRMAHLGSWGYAPATGILRCSDELLRIFDLDPATSVNDYKTLLERVHVQDRQRVLDGHLAALREGTPFQLKYRVLTRQGTERVVLEVGQTRQDAAGHVIEIFGAAQDISAQEAAAAALRKSELRYRRLYDSVRDAFASVDLQGRILESNPAFQHLLGYTADELQQMTYRDLTPERWHDYEARIIQTQVLQRGFSEVYEKECRRKDGSVFPVELRAFLALDEAGVAVGMSAIIRDVTERHRIAGELAQLNARLEQKVADRTASLQAREAQLSAILDAASDAIICIDQSGAILRINPATERMFGYPATELIGRNVSLLMPSPYREEHDEYLARYLRTGQPQVIGRGREARGRRRDGTEFPVELSLGEISHLGQFIGFIRDITRRKELEREVVEIASLEQQRIGQNLHDDLGQKLSGLGILASTIAETLQADSPRHASLAGKIELGLRDALRSVRSIARGLAVGELAGGGLPDALAEMASRLSETSTTHFVFEGDRRKRWNLPSIQATQLYHIAQEACTNALKHAGAQRVTISLRNSVAGLELRIRDDGRGLGTAPGGGLGLKVMQNRANLIGARLTIAASQPQGTLVECLCPREVSHAS